MNPYKLAYLGADLEWLDHVADDELPELLADLERLRARIWVRMLRGSEEDGKGGEKSPEPERDQLLKVQEVADILGVGVAPAVSSGHRTTWRMIRK